MIKALHFLPVYLPAWQFGGPILSVSRLCQGLAQQGVDVRVITTNAGLPDFPSDQLGIPQYVNGVQVVYYPVDQDRGVIRSRALVDSLPNHINWADILHLSSIWQPLGIPVQEAAYAAGVPVIQTLRGALGPYSWRRGWWKKIPYFFLKERPLLQRAALLHCTTSQEAREISCLGLKPPVELIPNPMDLSQLQSSPPLGHKWRLAMGLPAAEPLLLVVGRLHHKKGLDLIPKILKKIAHRPWQLVFIGNDDDGTGITLRRSINTLGLAQRCHWISTVPSDMLLGAYNAADLLLLPSRHENFGNVVVEALICGCPVLISNQVGVADDIKNLPGVQFLPRDHESWARAVEVQISKPKPDLPVREPLQQKFSTISVSSLVTSIYQRVLLND